MKFKYNFHTNQLWKLEGEYNYEISEESQFRANFGGNGFYLREQHWITFTIYATKIKVFMKQKNAQETLYYQKEIPLVPAWKLPLVVPQEYRQIKFEFTEQDQVIKNEKGWWTKKGTG